MKRKNGKKERGKTNRLKDKNRIEEQLQEIKSWRGKNAEVNSQLNDQQRENESLKQKLEDKNKAVDEAKIKEWELTEAIRVKNAEISELNTKLAETDQAKTEQAKATGEAATKLKELVAKIEALENTIKEKEVELARLKSEKERGTTSTDQNQKITSLEAEIKHLEFQLKKLQTEKNDLENRIYDKGKVYKSTLKDRDSKIVAQAEELKKQATENQKLEGELSKVRANEEAYLALLEKLLLDLQKFNEGKDHQTKTEGSLPNYEEVLSEQIIGLQIYINDLNASLEEEIGRRQNLQNELSDKITKYEQEVTEKRKYKKRASGLGKKVNDLTKQEKNLKQVIDGYLTRIISLVEERDGE